MSRAILRILRIFAEKFAEFMREKLCENFREAVEL